MRRAEEEILLLLRSAIEQSGEETIGHQRFRAITGVSESEWRYYWARWSEVLEEVGATPKGMQQRQDDDQVILSLIQAIRYYGRWPSDQDLRIYSRKHPEFPSANTIRSRGDKYKLAARLIELTHGDSRFQDVITICRRVGAPPDSSLVPNTSSRGFVYLYKAGRDYKIGMSTAPSRRAGEVGTLQPNAIEVVHLIETDDPAGVEQYWHRRFADKHVRGEWFKLDAQDVAAFKRWKKLI